MSSHPLRRDSIALDFGGMAMQLPDGFPVVDPTLWAHHAAGDGRIVLVLTHRDLRPVAHRRRAHTMPPHHVTVCGFSRTGAAHSNFAVEARHAAQYCRACLRCWPPTERSVPFPHVADAVGDVAGSEAPQ